jgi:hypothetical protein
LELWTGSNDCPEFLIQIAILSDYSPIGASAKAGYALGNLIDKLLAKLALR